MRNVLREIWENDRGNSLIIAGAALPLLLGSAGLATDTIQWALWKRQLQRAADSAAIAGVYDRSQNAGQTQNTNSAVNRDLAINNKNVNALQPGYPVITFPADSGTNKWQVKVDLAVKRPLSFSGMFMRSAPLIRTSATAASVPGTDEYCVVSLENTTKTGIQGAGNANITMDCGMITNSISSNAAAAQGSASITATVIAAAGGIQQSSNWNVQKYDPFVPAEEDPYKNLAPDANDFSSCPANPARLNINNSNSGQTISGGGCWSELSVGSNRNLKLKDGVYIIDGGDVDLQGDLTVENATIILTNKNASSSAQVGSFDMNASANLKITAPTTGKWKGMAIYQDRRAVDNAPTGNISSNSPNKINGNSSMNITGVLYFPRQQLLYNGNGTGGYQCTQFVVKRIVFSGNNAANNITKNCASFGVDPIQGGRLVRLVA